VNSLNGNESKVLEGNRSLDDSRIKRNGLPAGTPAPVFHLPQINGSELSLSDYSGRRMLLIFSDPNCGPCNWLAPKLEHLHHNLSGLQILMVSRDDLETNQVKISEHGLTFPIVLQRRWEISREYAMFATPVAYLIDEQGIIAADVAIGPDAILALAAEHETRVRSYMEGQIMRDKMQARLADLKKEFATRQNHLQELERQQANLREVLLQISGAIQILEELLADDQTIEQNGAHSDEMQPLSSQESRGSGDTAL
jgi:peroxiredoxin